jgi:hypothetical protein
VITSSTEYRVVNAIGRVVQTFGGLDARKCAVAFAKGERDRRGDLTVEEVTTTVQTRKVYRPRSAAPRMMQVEGAMA